MTSFHSQTLEQINKDHNTETSQDNEPELDWTLNDEDQTQLLVEFYSYERDDSAKAFSN